MVTNEFVRSAATDEVATGVGERIQGPVWNLGDLYVGAEDPTIEADLAANDRAAGELEAEYKGRLAEAGGDRLAAMIERYEAIEDGIGRVSSFAQLLFAANRDNPIVGQFYQGIQERVTTIGTKILFVTLELNKLEDASLAAMIAASERLQRFRPWLDTVRSYRPHQLSDAVEHTLHEKYVTGRSAWVRLFDETMAALRFPLDGKELTSAEVFDLLSSKDRAVREKAAGAISGVLEQNVRLFSRIMNTLVKDKQIEDEWRKFERPISSRNLANQVEDEVVAALIKAARDAYPRISHRYYALKARWLGLERLEFWDRNAPLPEDADTRRPWTDAKIVVLDAYRSFSPTLADIVNRFFTGSWIDAQLRPGKDSGAFCHPTVPSVHPYVLMNYQGRSRDVMTLAHELGHGVHQVLAARQGPLMAGTPLTLAETASVFGEQLTFQALLAQESDPVRRRVLLAAKIEDKINTVVRQIAFCDFERRVHDARRQAELTPDDLCQLWMEVQGESLGPAIHFREDYRFYWTYIPHFIHVPFYVYAYAFGDCLVSSLYAVYEEAPAGFESRYLDMLRAGGTLRHKELLAPFGLDASDPGFWAKGLGLLEGLIDQLEATMPGARMTNPTPPARKVESENSLGSRMRRYAQVGGAVGVQAARIAGARMMGRRLDAGNASDLREALGGLKGPLMKVAQLIATIPDALPAEYAAELAQLQSNAPPMSKPFVRRRMVAELGPDWASRFASFPLEPAAAASLGQVHKVVLHDGRTVACKLQYPNMEAAVDADLSQLRLIFNLHGRWDSSIDTSRIYEEIAARLREELDYEQEAKHLGLYRDMLIGEAHIHVPERIPELSTRRLLTMEWLQGSPLMQFKASSQEDRNKLALRMFRAWYVPFYGYGVIHGDPHLGNYTVRDDFDLNLLDFGCIRVFRPRFVKGVIDLYWALVHNDRDLAVAAYESWGFAKLDNATVDVLNEWASYLYGPLMQDRARSIEETNSSQEGRRVVERVHQKLREVGGVTPPREFVFMDRAAIGLGAVFLHLKAEVNWHRLFMELIDDFDVTRLKQRQTEALTRNGLPLPS